MDETTKVITDNINIRLDKVENQNDRQSNDITSIKLDIQKLNSKVDNLEDKVDSLDGKIDIMTNELKAEMKELRTRWENGLMEIDKQQKETLKSILEANNSKKESNDFWSKLKKSVEDKAVSIVTIVMFILLVMGIAAAYKNGIGLL